MIDKIKTGKYLKQLRLNKKREKDGKSFSQEDLSSEFYKRDMSISVNAIAEWESGASLPSPDNLEILSKIFNKTLDELLDGEDSVNIDYSKKYFIHHDSWGTNFDIKANLYQIRNEQIKLITNRFKELLIKRLKRPFTANEENEFRFLFTNYYQVSNYIEEYTKLEVNDDYLKFKDALNEILVEIRNMSLNEKYWEVQKLYRERKVLHFTFRLDVHDLRRVPILQERFKEIEDWQKDMLLAMFQSIEPYNDKPEELGANYYKRYEESHGEYNHELNVKNDIKELINRGAYFNKCYLNMKHEKIENKRIIDKIQELYDLCLKPIEISIFKDGKTKTYLIENNAKNRFINKYYYQLRYAFKKFGNNDDLYEDIDELYKWFISNNEPSEEDYLRIANEYKIDINQEKKYWVAEAKKQSMLDKWFYEYKDIENKIALGLNELKELESKLNNGEKEYPIKNIEIIGGKDEDSIRDYIHYWNTKIDYSDYLKGRDKQLTKELLKDLDILTLEEIKKKYFEMEVVEDE